LRLATRFAENALETLEVTRKIHEKVSSKFEQDQREVVLRRQLAAIQEELG